MLARILYIAVAISILGALPRPGRGRASEAPSGTAGAQSHAAWAPRAATRR